MKNNTQEIATNCLSFLRHYESEISTIYESNITSTWKEELLSQIQTLTYSAVFAFAETPLEKE